jgi:hypothetical protein
MKTKNILIVAFISLIILNSCKRETSSPSSEKLLVKKELTDDDKILLNKFQLASYVISDMIADKTTRNELNKFILAKVKKTGSDESLSFEEIFSGRTLKLEGVDPNFFDTFKDKFVKTLLAKKYRHHEEIAINFQNENEILAYFGQKKSSLTTLSSDNKKTNFVPSFGDDFIDPGFEIYFPYSENFEGAIYPEYPNYAVSYNPITNDEENNGEVFNYDTGEYLYDNLVNDDYAYTTPTYILTVDDGISYSDFANVNFSYTDFSYLINAPIYNINVYDYDYNPYTISNPTISSTPPGGIGVCVNRDLWVQNGRWTALHDGNGLFEGQIEFAVSTLSGVTSLTIPTGTNNPVADMTVEKFSYQPISRYSVKNMKKKTSSSVSLGFHFTPWCPGDVDKMLVIYEYDRGSKSSGAFCGVVSSAAGLFKDTAMQNIVKAGAVLVKAAIDGATSSKVKHFSIIKADNVYQNMRTPAIAMSPTLINGIRPYGTNQYMVSLLID